MFLDLDKACTSQTLGCRPQLSHHCCENAGKPFLALRTFNFSFMSKSPKGAVKIRHLKSNVKVSTKVEMLLAKYEESRKKSPLFFYVLCQKKRERKNQMMF